MSSFYVFLFRDRVNRTHPGLAWNGMKISQEKRKSTYLFFFFFSCKPRGISTTRLSPSWVIWRCVLKNPYARGSAPGERGFDSAGNDYDINPEKIVFRSVESFCYQEQDKVKRNAATSTTILFYLYSCLSYSKIFLKKNS